MPDRCVYTHSDSKYVHVYTVYTSIQVHVCRQTTSFVFITFLSRFQLLELLLLFMLKTLIWVNMSERVDISGSVCCFLPSCETGQLLMMQRA